ncbi:EEF1A lysine methyltransferase 2-like [Tigriopus californicus]|uniref:EEF1A lysine methyltransferase 2-like n=1 Tax=Tigriopus californicus TaxID=6832 RepID=UPI0027DA656C|nr:EEF1A lysine methyltransferase 2-like [Tigriopus californicus]XP_059093258.1 EEF1A lysine methyltransferase 2-like [Tigriopus californicus]
MRQIQPVAHGHVAPGSDPTLPSTDHRPTHAPYSHDDEDNDEDELPGSVLGTKEHWDATYATELKNFDDHGDEGEIWFGEDSLFRVLRWFDRNEDKVPKTAEILDLGCGNGVTCVHLAQEGFSRVTGVDYSPDAIALSLKLAEKHDAQGLTFETCDILNLNSSPLLSKTYNVILDKGTYDAVSLDPEDTKTKRNIYIRHVQALLDPQGYFFITSCNWTEEELIDHFSAGFRLHQVIPTPQFQFGGKVGNMVTSVIFVKS